MKKDTINLDGTWKLIPAAAVIEYKSYQKTTVLPV